MEPEIPAREVLDRLRELAEATRHRQPSAAIEARLMRAFTDAHPAPVARRVYWPLAAAAAVVLVALTPLVVLRMTEAPAGSPSSVSAPLQDPLEGFVPVPGAAALPQLESASIVRYEFPLAALPAYGVDIVPDAPRRAVEADLLIGQDGHARAIRIAWPTDGNGSTRGRE